MRIFSPAKVNLALNVGPLQPNGYHLVDSVFHTLYFGDIITLERAQNLSLTCSVDLGISPEQNLAYKAAVQLGAAFGIEPAVSIHIEKRIPHGAGLGGGSSNAAAVLYGLSCMWDINPRDPRCMQIASDLGADVSVFLAPTGASVMTGYGETLKESLAPATGVPVVLIMDREAHTPTGSVYQAFDANPQPVQDMSNLLVALESCAASPGDPEGIAALGANLYNNLALASAGLSPQVGGAFEFIKSDALSVATLVSGSGGACFSLCNTMVEAKQLAQHCREAGYWSEPTELSGKGVWFLHTNDGE